LHLGRCAVDFVGQQQVGEHRAQRRAELARLLVVDARAHQVGRHEVGRELDALEAAAHGARERLHRQRLGQPRHTFDQQVALRQHGHQHALEKAVLADDDALDFVEHALHQRGGGLGVVFHEVPRRAMAVFGGAAAVQRASLGVRTAAGRRRRRRFRSARRSRCR
jgi:hypothetical protein